MEQGREVLRGHLPYLTHWDNGTPFQWYISGLFILLSGGNLVAFRFLGALYIGITSYVVYRCLADQHKLKCAWWAASLYLIFSSSLQASQSFSPEQVITLPFAVLLYHVLNAPTGPSAWHRRRVLVLFGVCSWLMGSFLCMLPAVAALYPALYNPFPRQTHGWRKWFYATEPYAVRSVMLLVVSAVGYVFLMPMYLLHARMGFYWASVFDAPSVISASDMSLPIFMRSYFSKFLRSDQWLMAVLIAFFLLKAGLLAIQKQLRYESFLWRLLLLFIGAVGMIYARGNHNSLFLFYSLQGLPLFALMMGYALNFNLADLRWFALAIAIVGLHNTTQAVQKQWGKLIAYSRGDNTQQAAFLGDRLYRVRDVLATFPLEGESLIICGEDDMLYPLTGMENPRFFYFPFLHYNTALHKAISYMPLGLRAMVNDTKPLYIVGRDADPMTHRGFMDIGDILQKRYVQVANIDGTLIYLRNDKLQRIFTIQ